MTDKRIQRSELWELLRENIPLEEHSQSESIVRATEPYPHGMSVKQEKKKTAAINDTATNYLKDIRKFAAWGGIDGKNSLERAKILFLEECPDLKTKADSAERSGVSDRKLFDKSYRLGIKNKAKDEVRSLLKSNSASFPEFVIGKIWQQYHRGLKVYAKISEENLNRKNKNNLSTVKQKSGTSKTMIPEKSYNGKRIDVDLSNLTNLHPSDIRSLKPSKSWHLVIDETGTDFGEDASLHTKSIGRFVGLLVPDNGSILPKLKNGWHSVDESNAEIDRVLQILLNSTVGIFGLDVRSLPVTRGERWLDGIALLIDWVLRLMPIDGICNLEVFIEQRGCFNSTPPWDVIRRDCLRRLALAYTSRARNIGLNIQVIGKTGHQVNGYTDAVAYTWAQTSKSSTERLYKSQLLGTCLLDSSQGADARSMLYSLDSFKQGINIPPSAWWDLLQSRNANNSSSIMTSFLKNIGVEAKNSVLCWNGFLKEVKNRMAITTLSIHALAKAVNWLQLYQPKTTSIPPVMRLAWLTVQLAQANHMGATEDKWESELELLGTQLFDETAPFVCQADLNRAVAATNRFDFSRAEFVLSKWNKCKPSEPGLLYWGQLQSSFGQHASFQDENRNAIPFFKKALGAFDRLSDEETRKRNLSQTRSYLAIAMMDCSQISAIDVRVAVEAVTGNLNEATIILAKSENPIDRYAHHLLLRWLVYRGDAESLTSYFTNRENWITGRGHPWELILLYRGILLHPTEPDIAIDLALQAADIAFGKDSGPTVKYIGACCRIVASIWGKEWNEKKSILNKLVIDLPYAKDRISMLLSIDSDTTSPIDFLKAALPFNFR